MPTSPYTVETVDIDELEDKLSQLDKRQRRVISILPATFDAGDFDNYHLSVVKIVHVGVKDAICTSHSANVS